MRHNCDTQRPRHGFHLHDCALPMLSRNPNSQASRLFPRRTRRADLVKRDRCTLSLRLKPAVREKANAGAAARPIDLRYWKIVFAE
jgi:hypothetical protein